MTTAISVLLVDDEALVRAGFRMVIEAQPDLRVVGDAGDGRDAIIAARTLRPDVVLMDIRMRVIDGLEATRQILAEPGPPKVIVLTTFDLDEYVFDSLRAGASGYLLKDVPPEELARSIRIVAAGDAVIQPSVTRRLVEAFAAGRATSGPAVDDPELTTLTERELEVFKLLGAALSNADIADRLGVSETTAKTHVAHVLMKLGLRDRAQAVVRAYESGVRLPGAS